MPASGGRETKLREEAGYARLLEQVAVAANTSATSDTAFQVCLDLVCAQVGWPVGHVYRSQADGSGLVPTSLWHLDDPERFAAFRAITERTRFAPGIGLPGRVLASGAPAWIPDVTKDANFPRAKHAIDIGVRAGVRLPDPGGSGGGGGRRVLLDSVDPSESAAARGDGARRHADRSRGRARARSRGAAREPAALRSTCSKPRRSGSGWRTLRGAPVVRSAPRPAA